MIPTLLTAAMTIALLSSATDHGPQVRRLMQPIIDAGLVPSLVVGICQNGESYVYGLGEISEANPVAPDGKTLFEVGSISKVFTGVLLADAVDRGTVKLDDPLSKYFPDGVKAPQRDEKEVLLWHLSTHTSGLPRIPDNMKDVASDNPYKSYDAKRLWEFMGRAELATEPGTTYAYSNLGAGLLGTILADASKSTYEKLLKDRITKPLGMTNTAVSLTRKQKKALATPHAGGRAVSVWDFDALVGCGGIRSNVDDMLKFIKATLSQGGNPVERAITRSTERKFDLPNAPAGIGLGWHIAQDGSTLWHNGQTGGYHSAMFISKGFNLGVVVLSNGDASSIDEGAQKILQSLLGMNVAPPHVRKGIDVAPEKLDRLVGVYPSERGFTITVTRDGDALMAQLTGQPAYRVWAVSPTFFFYRVVAADLEFEIDEKTNRASSVMLLQNGQKMLCRRKDP